MRCMIINGDGWCSINLIGRGSWFLMDNDRCLILVSGGAAVSSLWWLMMAALLLYSCSMWMWVLIHYHCPMLKKSTIIHTGINNHSVQMISCVFFNEIVWNCYIYFMISFGHKNAMLLQVDPPCFPGDLGYWMGEAAGAFRRKSAIMGMLGEECNGE